MSAKAFILFVKNRDGNTFPRFCLSPNTLLQMIVELREDESVVTAFCLSESGTVQQLEPIFLNGRLVLREVPKDPS